MSNCFVYCRKSSEDKTKQILSLDDQERICLELAKSKSLQVLEIFKESKSAKRPDKRMAFGKMMSGIRAGKTNTIVCWRADRLTRNAKEGGALIDLVDYGQLKILTPTMDYDRNNSTFLFIEFGMATKFSKDLSDNVKRGLATKLRLGHCPGPAPIGYINNKFKEKGQKDISPDPKSFDLCRKWWDLMLTGKDTVESSLKEVTKLGLRSKKGKVLSNSQPYDFFRNIFYTGLFDYAGERYEGVHEPMVTMPEYNRVQEIINSRTRKYKVKNNFYFMKVLKCAECGSAITAEQHTKHYKNGESQTFIYARCTKKKGKCSQPFLNAIDLEKQVLAFVKNLEISPSLVDWIRGVLKRRNEKEFQFEKALKANKTKRLQALLDEKKELYGMKIDGLIDKEDYQKEKARLLVEEKQVKEGIKHDNIATWTKVMEDTLAFAANVTKIFRNKDPEVRRLVLRILGSNLILKEKKVLIKAKNAFIFLKKADGVLNGSICRLEPKEMPINGEVLIYSKPDFLLELNNILSSNLFDSITPELIFQLNQLKEKLGVEGFAYA